MLRMWTMRLSQGAFLATTAGEFRTDRSLKEVLHSGSGKLTNARLISESPGSGSGWERRTHPQATGWVTMAKGPLRLVSSKPSSSAPVPGSLGRHSLSEPGAEPPAVTNPAGGRAAAVGTPRAQQREGTWEKGLVPAARQRLGLGLFFEVTHKPKERPPAPGLWLRAERLGGSGSSRSPRIWPAGVIRSFAGAGGPRAATGAAGSVRAAGPGLGGAPGFLSPGPRAHRSRGRARRAGNWAEAPEPCPPGRGTERSGRGEGSERPGARVGHQRPAGLCLGASPERRSRARTPAAAVLRVRWRRARDARFSAENRQLRLDGGGYRRAAARA